MEDETLTPTPAIVEMIPPLPYEYDPDDERINALLDNVSAFCGANFTEVPQNPDEEPGVAVPLADEGIEVSPGPDKETPETNPDEEYGGNEHDNSGAEKYPEGTNLPNEEGEQDPNVPNPDLDALREAYKTALAKNIEEKTDYWAKLWQVIRLISAMGCWTESHDDTFILQYRTQRFEAEQVWHCGRHCSCADDAIEIPIEYAPLERHPDDDKNPIERESEGKPFIKAVISVVVNGRRCEDVIPQEYLNSHYDPYTQKLYISRDDFPDLLLAAQCPKTCCLCKRKLTITLWYNAGYYGIPQSILPLVCQLMGKIEDSKKPLSDCTAAVTQVSGLLKSMKTGNIQYMWSDRDNSLGNTQALFTEIYNIASMAELFGLSRCDIINHEEAGDVI